MKKKFILFSPWLRKSPGFGGGFRQTLKALNAKNPGFA